MEETKSNALSEDAVNEGLENDVSALEKIGLVVKQMYERVK